MEVIKGDTQEFSIAEPTQHVQPLFEIFRQRQFVGQLRAQLERVFMPSEWDWETILSSSSGRWMKILDNS